MKGKMKKILLAVTSSVLLITSILGLSSCRENEGSEDNTPKNYDILHRLVLI